MNEQTPRAVPDPDDDIRRALKQGSGGTSASHDENVLAMAADAADEISSRSPRTRSGPPVWLLPAAAALAAVLLVPVFLPEPADTLRSTQAAVQPAPNARLEEAPDSFEWPFVSGARSYEVVLRDAGATEVWRSGDVSGERVAAGDARALMDAGGTFLWTVEATTPGGTTELGPYQFTIANQ